MTLEVLSRNLSIVGKLHCKWGRQEAALANRTHQRTFENLQPYRDGVHSKGSGTPVEIFSLAPQ